MEKKIRCVLIDDQLEVLDRLEALLVKTDLVLVEGKSSIPEKGIEMVLRLVPDIVFTDVEMPRISGFEVVESIRSQQCYPEVIFVTAYNQYAIKAIKEQAFDYLLKPIDYNELKDTVDRYHSHILKKSGQIIPDEIKALLSSREIDVLLLVLKGLPSKEIAEQLFVSLATVNTHRQNILQKTGSKSTQELIANFLKRE